jgi:hypothetical protein
MRRNAFALGLIALASLTLTGAGVGAAQAAPQSAVAFHAADDDDMGAAASVQHFTIDDPMCAAVSDTPSACSAQVTVELSASVLEAAPDAGHTHAIHSRIWKQTASGTGARGIFWSEVHTGKFYYNNTRAWVAEKHGGFTGYHRCDQSRGLGFTVVGKHCDVVQDYATHVDNVDIWELHVVAGAIPVYRTASMTMQVYKNGVVTPVPWSWV